MSGFLGMMIATFANARTALEAQSGIKRAFVVAFRSGAVMVSHALHALHALYPIQGL